MQEQLDFTNSRVLVVGDVMLDRYWSGSTARVSPEAPVPVVKIENDESRPGGAANVALNIAALGGRATLLALTGDDDAAKQLERLMLAQGVTTALQKNEQIQTISKLRVMSRHQQLIRLDFEDNSMAPWADSLNQPYQQGLADCDVVLLSDYAKGTLDNCQQLIQKAIAAGKKVLIDPKGNDFSHYRGATLLTPNWSEFCAIVGDVADDTDLEQKARDLCVQFDLSALLVTRGEQGMSLITADEAHHYPTQALDVYDVTGAGDTVIAALAVALARDIELPVATQMANMAAGIVVAKSGTATASVDELRREIHNRKPLKTGSVDEDQLMDMLDIARANGETIVLTNGCFDMLHAGHVTYLQQAASLGDRLIVAVNIDQTVRDLKGPDRPVNTLDRRMTVLAALGCVDWVVAFNEETPERIICRVKPDYLVKGGDNDPDKIPGAACTREAGGVVKVMSYLDNCSTTGTIQSIREKQSSE